VAARLDGPAQRLRERLGDVVTADRRHAFGDEDCGIRDVLDRLGDRWTVLVMAELSKGVRRFRELERGVPGISRRMLTLTTKRLCRDRIVEMEAVAAARDRWDAEQADGAAWLGIGSAGGGAR